MNKKETLNHVRSYQNIVKIKGPRKDRDEPLPTTIDEGFDEFKGRRVEILPTDGVVWCRTGVGHPILDRSRRRVERHGAEGVGQRLLVLACASPGVPAWGGSGGGLMVQQRLL
jgi:hypothetical protein